jgi:hypothetical protein
MATESQSSPPEIDLLTEELHGNPVAATDRVHFTISWNEDEEAILIRLVDNDQSVALPGSGVVGRGSMSLAYKTRAAVTHVIEWRVTFPGKTLTGLAAVARRYGDGNQVDEEDNDLGDADEAEHVWAERGTL